MMTFKPAWLVERELPTQLLQVGTQLLALPSSSKYRIGLLDKVGILLSQVYQEPSKSIRDTLMPIKGVSIPEVLTNQAGLDVQIPLASCFLSSFVLQHQIPLLMIG